MTSSFDPAGPRSRRVFKRVVLLVALLAVGGAAFTLWRASPLLHSATGSVSHALCGAAFISKVDAEQVYREDQLPMPGMSGIAWALRYRIDRERREVRTTAFGGFATRAVYREGYGCSLAQGDAPAAIEPALPLAEPKIAAAAPALVEAIDSRLLPALDAAFAEVDARRLRQTKAVLVLHDGKVIAERYAPGYGAETPVWGHSLTKSVTSALIGILVRDGKLKLDQPVPVAAWQAAGDARREVTVDQLIRMTSGLPFDETNDALNPATRLFMLERDTAEFAARQPLANAPGTHWGYSNLSYALLSGAVRDAAGAGPAETLGFVQRELFQPLGMQHASLEFDAAGAPVGAGFMYASARDWARFGQLYLDDGVANGQRILPEGWAAYSATPPLASSGYGAGFWTNRQTAGEIPYWGIGWGLDGVSPDAYFGRGYLGQFIVIVPSARLVVVRLGMSHDTSTGIAKLTSSIIETLQAGAAATP